LILNWILFYFVARSLLLIIANSGARSEGGVSSSRAIDEGPKNLRVSQLEADARSEQYPQHRNPSPLRSQVPQQEFAEAHRPPEGS